MQCGSQYVVWPRRTGCRRLRMRTSVRPLIGLFPQCPMARDSSSQQALGSSHHAQPSGNCIHTVSWGRGLMRLLAFSFHACSYEEKRL